MTKKRYTVSVKKSAAKSIRRFSKDMSERILDAIEGLADNPRPRGCGKIEGDLWRIWVGRHYRVIYKIDDEKKTVTVTKAATREGAY